MEIIKSDFLKLLHSANNETVTETEKITMSQIAQEWIKKGQQISNPKPLFGSFLHEGEVGILFSNTGVGKSTLAVQLADCISKGKSILELETTKKKVLYFDFELSTKAFQMRYTGDDGETFKFSELFIRVEIDRRKPYINEEKSFEEMVLDSIKIETELNKPDVIIIDNITYLSAANEKSQEALALMKLILDISRSKQIAVLLIGHTPKRDLYRPIQLEDLAGSKALSNFADTVFCIGQSKNSKEVRYLKHLKNRNFPVVFDKDNVLECEVVKENAYLHFRFLDYSNESEHLNNNESNANDIPQIEELLSLKNQEYSNVEIGKKLGISEATVRRRLKKIADRFD